MKIAVIGCGAMGSVYAGRLASAGHEVLVIDRWAEHMSAIAEHGLLVAGPGGRLRASVRSHTTPPEEPVDLVVLAVKAADVASATGQALPLLGPGTIVLTIQNGFGSADVVADRIGADRIAVGVASGFGASVTRPGEVHHNAMRALRFGGYRGIARSEIERVAGAWRLGGFDVEAVSDIGAMQWEKLICNVAYSAPCALTGLTVGEVMEHEHIGPVSRAAAEEAWDIARAREVRIQVTDPIALVREFGAQMPAAKPSALLDHEARRTSEIMFINGAVPREAAKVGREAPVNATLTALVREREVAWANDRPADRSGG